MKRAIPIIVLALVFASAGWFVRQCMSPSEGDNSARKDGTAATADARQSVVGMGRIEPASGLIDVNAMMGDRLARLLVEEGSQVEKGAPLAEMESRSLRGLELEAANGQLSSAEGRLQVEQQLADTKIEAAELNLRKAESAAIVMAAHRKKIELLKVGLELARKDQKRIEGLSKDMATDQERERHALLVQQADSELGSARATLDQLSLGNELALAAAQLELKATKEAKKQLPFVIPIDSLGISRNLAQLRYDQTQVVAPCRGTVLKVHVRPGETIGPKPILQIADLERMIVVVEVYENEVKHLKVGQSAHVTSKAFLPPFDENGVQGKVTRIGRMISTPVLKNIDPFAPADRHVVEVRVELDEEGSQQSAAFSNLQVDVRFDKEGGRGKAEGGEER